MNVSLRNILVVTVLVTYICCLCDLNFWSFLLHGLPGKEWSDLSDCTLGSTWSLRSPEECMSYLAHTSYVQFLHSFLSPSSRPTRQQTASQATHPAQTPYCEEVPRDLCIETSFFLFLSLLTRWYPCPGSKFYSRKEYESHLCATRTLHFIQFNLMKKV
jgi:hypothetical protein